MVFKKIFKLKNIKEKFLGEFINICFNDGQRMFEVVVVGSLLVGGFVVVILGMIYNVIILGLIGFLGLVVFIFFYLVMMFVLWFIVYFRRKCVVVMDECVQKMNEVFIYIKFIKMYVWVKVFFQSV